MVLLWIGLWAAFCLVVIGAALLVVVGEALRMGRGRRVPLAKAAETILKPGLLWGMRGPFPVVGISWIA